MTTALSRGLVFWACALALACEPVGPEVSDGSTSDADAQVDVSVTDAQPDAAVDTAKPDVAPADVPGDVTANVNDALADAVLDAADGVADAVPDAVADAATDAMTMEMPDAGDIAAELPISPTNIDVVGISWACTDTAWQPPVCAPGIVMNPPLLPGYHVDLPNPITYTDVPPSSGTHRPVWGVFGEYVFLPEQRWLHNIEHGAIAFLYHPCAPPATIDALRALLKAQPADASGAFRWVLTPYPGLPSTLAAVSWGHVYEASCVQADEIKAFIAEHYRKAPEDEFAPGGYSELSLGNWP